jgi:dihydropteroate synthase
LLSASNKTFLGVVLGLEIGQRKEASVSATSLGAILGCRIMRVHEVGAHRQACDAVAAMLAAGR